VGSREYGVKRKSLALPLARRIPRRGLARAPGMNNQRAARETAARPRPPRRAAGPSARQKKTSRRTQAILIGMGCSGTGYGFVFRRSRKAASPVGKIRAAKRPALTRPELQDPRSPSRRCPSTRGRQMQERHRKHFRRARTTFSGNADVVRVGD